MPQPETPVADLPAGIVVKLADAIYLNRPLRGYEAVALAVAIDAHVRAVVAESQVVPEHPDATDEVLRAGQGTRWFRNTAFCWKGSFQRWESGVMVYREGLDQPWQRSTVSSIDGLFEEGRGAVECSATDAGDPDPAPAAEPVQPSDLCRTPTVDRILADTWTPDEEARFAAWLADSSRQSPALTFTAGAVRWAADAVWDSGVLDRRTPAEFEKIPEIGDDFTLAELAQLGLEDCVEEYVCRIGQVPEAIASQPEGRRQAMLVDALSKFATDCRAGGRPVPTKAGDKAAVSEGGPIPSEPTPQAECRLQDVWHCRAVWRQRPDGRYEYKSLAPYSSGRFCGGLNIAPPRWNEWPQCNIDGVIVAVEPLPASAATPPAPTFALADLDTMPPSRAMGEYRARIGRLPHGVNVGPSEESRAFVYASLRQFASDYGADRPASVRAVKVNPDSVALAPPEASFDVATPTPMYWRTASLVAPSRRWKWIAGMMWFRWLGSLNPLWSSWRVSTYNDINDLLSSQAVTVCTAAEAGDDTPDAPAPTSPSQPATAKRLDGEDDIGKRYAEGAVVWDRDRQQLRAAGHAGPMVELVNYAVGQSRSNTVAVLATLINAAVAEATADRDRTIVDLNARLQEQGRLADATTARTAELEVRS